MAGGVAAALRRRAGDARGGERPRVHRTRRHRPRDGRRQMAGTTASTHGLDWADGRAVRTPGATRCHAAARARTNPGKAAQGRLRRLRAGRRGPTRQYKARTGSLTVSRGHVETLPDGTEMKLGVFLSNTKTRRTKLTQDKRQQLVQLGAEWAA